MPITNCEPIGKKNEMTIKFKFNDDNSYSIPSEGNMVATNLIGMLEVFKQRLINNNLKNEK